MSSVWIVTERCPNECKEIIGVYSTWALANKKAAEMAAKIDPESRIWYDEEEHKLNEL
jgi:hypothetical protein